MRAFSIALTVGMVICALSALLAVATLDFPVAAVFTFLVLVEAIWLGYSHAHCREKASDD